MLKPEQIREKVFQTTGRGSYRAEDVDAFLSEVNDSYSEMFKANAEFVKKISILANKVEEYRNDEDSLKEALISAQKLADKTVKEANSKAEHLLVEAENKAKALNKSLTDEASNIISDAKNKADGIILNAKKEAEEILGTVNRKVTQESLAFDMLQKESSDFRSKLITMYKQHLSLINELPALAEEKLNEINSSKTEKTVKEEEPTPPVQPEPEIEEKNVVEEIAAANEDVAEDISSESISDDSTDSFSEEEQFTLADITDDEDEEEFVDISSSSEDSDDGFSLDISDVDLDDEELEQKENPLAGNYASVEDSVSSEDNDDDDEPVSFKSFFKKK